MAVWIQVDGSMATSSTKAVSAGFYLCVVSEVREFFAIVAEVFRVNWTSKVLRLRPLANQSVEGLRNSGFVGDDLLHGLCFVKANFETMGVYSSSPSSLADFAFLLADNFLLSLSLTAGRSWFINFNRH